MSVGFPSPGGLLINGKLPSATESKTIAMTDEIDKAVQATSEADAKDGKVKTGGAAADAPDADSGTSSQSIAIKTLQKRMKELQELLRQQEQQLAAAEKASYPSDDVRTTTLMGIQSQISQTNGSLMEVANALVKALTDQAGKASAINTTA
ncbi:hypothetical protein HX782_18740 [Pseudomonas gingeri]|uniref:Uncharacterized protein n=2 Tax=Pseudomonas gingeri TaxID=117681 RepID=A0A7Y8CNS9_9PSED|nr:hypothetical protein [Pseudomonas gingeri]NWA15699.1 hypothetical protein [Pseudomonas gingeri]NWA56169.1 hypothetical protein [Pseudomonas gingeri]NWA97302.1 hypothetical protein [Pseudomonas gingeri]NWB04994.1 hypothetical protein [Pseudomonas gingeri]